MARLLLLLPCAWAAMSCSPNAEVRYAGKTRPAREGEVQVIASRDRPAGYAVLGVITARCTSLDGSSGLFNPPCTDETLTDKARAQAATVGGDALVDVQCGIEGTDQYLTTVGQGLPGTSERKFRACQATVLVAEPGAAPPPVAEAPDRVIGDDPFAIETTGEPRPGEPLDPSVVGRLEAFPAGFDDLGTVTVRCLAVCTRSSTERALVLTAAERGALSVAELACELRGERWRCAARLVGEERPTTPPAPPSDELSPDG